MTLRNAEPLRRPEGAEGGAAGKHNGGANTSHRSTPAARVNATIPDVNMSAPCPICGGPSGPSGRGRRRRCGACDVEFRAATAGKAVRP